MLALRELCLRCLPRAWRTAPFTTHPLAQPVHSSPAIPPLAPTGCVGLCRAVLGSAGLSLVGRTVISCGSSRFGSRAVAIACSSLATSCALFPTSDPAAASGAAASGSVPSPAWPPSSTISDCCSCTVELEGCCGAKLERDARDSNLLTRPSASAVNARASATAARACASATAARASASATAARASASAARACASAATARASVKLWIMLRRLRFGMKAALLCGSGHSTLPLPGRGSNLQSRADRTPYAEYKYPRVQKR